MLHTIPDLNIITSFPLDYMHLVCLGTVKKLILLWIKGPIRVRYPSWKIKEISILLEKLKINTPCEIARKPRGLDQIRWKATEFWTFLLYIGPIVLKPILFNEQWKHFFNLSISFIILLSPNCSQLIDIRNKLLENFVKQFEVLYGRHLMSHNIHGLLHICNDYKVFGPLDKCSAFPFENYMHTLKRTLRKPHKPLEQVIKRLNEMKLLHSNINIKKDSYFCSGCHSKGSLIDDINMNSHQFSTLKLNTFIIKTHVDADSYLITKDNDIIKVFNIIKVGNKDTDEILLICKQFVSVDALYNKPINSTLLNIYTFNNKLSQQYFKYSLNEIKNKMFLIPSNNSYSTHSFNC